jgi:hypothetical protein
VSLDEYGEPLAAQPLTPARRDMPARPRAQRPRWALNFTVTFGGLHCSGAPVLSS